MSCFCLALTFISSSLLKKNNEIKTVCSVHAGPTVVVLMINKQKFGLFCLLFSAVCWESEKSSFFQYIVLNFVLN